MFTDEFRKRMNKHMAGIEIHATRYGYTVRAYLWLPRKQADRHGYVDPWGHFRQYRIAKVQPTDVTVKISEAITWLDENLPK